MVDKKVDILIVGGGLIGAALMLALENSGYEIALVEAVPFNDQGGAGFDARTLALSPSTMQILSMLDIWPLIKHEICEIQTIHVSQQAHFGMTRLKGEDTEPLGSVVEMQYLQQAFFQRLPLEKILAPACLIDLDSKVGLAKVKKLGEEISIQAKLVVAADGSDSMVRRLCGLTAQIKDYHQHAIIANIGLSRSHCQTAYERFTENGSLALLPMTKHRSALVWSLPPSVADRYMKLPDRLFLSALQQVFGYRLGRLGKIGKRTLFPLRQVKMTQKAFWPIVFVGNAANTLHPIAGQGFNLGLRDVIYLAQCILQKGINPCMLEFYQQARRVDQQAIMQFTDRLVSLFSMKAPGISFLRGAGLLALDNLLLTQKIMTHFTQGFAGVTPDLVCGIPIKREEHEHSI